MEKTTNQKINNDFLSNDLIERMIRVEQRVAVSFNDPISYDKTQYFKSLSDCEKKKFEKYLKTKGIRNKVLLSGLFLFFATLFLLRFELTGLAVNPIVENPEIDYVLFGLLGLIVVIIVFSFIFLYLRNRKFEKHYEVLEDILLKKKILRKKIK